MAQSDGEKELILGNRHLISLFFVVVALCGVFFAMGYMIGRNSGKTSLAGSASGNSPAAQESAAREPASVEPGSRDTAPLSSPEPVAGDSPGDGSSPATHAAADTPPSPAPPPAASAKEAKKEARKDPPTAVSPVEAGATYLQVTALHRADADNLVKTLREQSFPVVLAESSKSDLFRVLVGPYRQTAQVAEAKARLKSLGFANAFVQH